MWRYAGSESSTVSNQTSWFTSIWSKIACRSWEDRAPLPARPLEQLKIALQRYVRRSKHRTWPSSLPHPQAALYEENH